MLALRGQCPAALLASTFVHRWRSANRSVTHVAGEIGEFGAGHLRDNASIAYHSRIIHHRRREAHAAPLRVTKSSHGRGLAAMVLCPTVLAAEFLRSSAPCRPSTRGSIHATELKFMVILLGLRVIRTMELTEVTGFLPDSARSRDDLVLHFRGVRSQIATKTQAIDAAIRPDAKPEGPRQAEVPRRSGSPPILQGDSRSLSGLPGNNFCAAKSCR